MDAVEFVMVIFAGLALVMAGGFALLCHRALRAARSLEAAVAEFRAVAEPAVEDLANASRRAVREVDRVDDLLDVATVVGTRVEGASEAAYRAFTSPMIKGVAFASGTRRAARALRRERRRDRRRSAAPPRTEVP